jgi:hypothetical protein
MLALKLGLSLVSNRKLGSWLPTDETSVVAWYQNGEGITLNGTDVSQWADSANSYDMDQTDEVTEQPAYNASTGALTFDSSGKENLQTSSQISLAGDFTIGIRLYPTDFEKTFLGDNTENNYLFKYTTTSNLRFKVGGTAGNIALDSGTFGDDYLVITRDSDVITLHKNGVAQSTTVTKSGAAKLDAIGIRNPDVNSYDGEIFEIQIFSSTSSDLTANVNTYLSKL